MLLSSRLMQNNKIGNILALDIGDARIGIAIGHTIARLPHPLGVIPAQPISDAIVAIRYTITAQQEVISIVIGTPLNENGEQTAQAKKIEAFVSTLKKDISLPIVYVDESFSSVDADAYIAQHKLSTKHNDSIAACMVLQRYFDMQEQAYV